MKSTKRIFIFSILIGLLFVNISSEFVLSSGKSFQNKPSRFNISSTRISKVFEFHLPVIIRSNEDFQTQGFSGSGSSTDPYRIEYLNITTFSNNLISISNTTVFFRIAHNYLNGLSFASSAISLSNLENAIVENNTLIGCSYGLQITSVRDSIFRSNTAHSNSDLGFFIIKADRCQIISNKIHDNLKNGVYLRETTSVTIMDNFIFNHCQGELPRNNLLLYDCSDTLIANNSLFEGHIGINLLNNSNNNEITENTINNNVLFGIRIEYSFQNRITTNNISSNLEYGVLIELGANENIIRYNDFIDNNLGGVQAKDDGASNAFKYNYWNEWPIIDINNNLIIDNPYPIDGYADNSDPYPLVSINEFLKRSSQEDFFFLFLIFSVIVIAVLILGITYYYYPEKFRRKLRLATIQPPLLLEEAFSTNQIELLKPIYNKLIVGIDNVQNSPLYEPVETVVITEPSDPLDLVEYFPNEIKKDLLSGLKGRTLLTLIEIGFQDPSETNLVKLAQNLDIPVSTLSKDIKQLNKLKYVETYVSGKVLRDARYRNYTITPKGYKFLLTLKEALKITINRLKETSFEENT